MLPLVATDAGPHDWDAPEVLLLSSTSAWPLFDDLCDTLGPSETASSWLLARLWHLTGGSVGVLDNVEHWSDGACLMLDFLLLGPGSRPAAHVLLELNQRWFGTLLTWSVPQTTDGIDFDDPVPPPEIKSLCAQATATLTADPEALAPCRVTLCDFERAVLPWVCGWDGETFESTDRFAYLAPGSFVIRRRGP